MNEKRMSHMESSFKDLHGIKPNVFHETVDHNSYKIRLKYGKNEVTLQETIERGLTKKCDLTFNGVTQEFKSVYEAEQAATKLLKE